MKDETEWSNPGEKTGQKDEPRNNSKKSVKKTCFLRNPVLKYINVRRTSDGNASEMSDRKARRSIGSLKNFKKSSKNA